MPSKRNGFGFGRFSLSRARLIGGIIVFVLLLTLLRFWAVVPAGHHGVLLQSGAVKGVLGGGLHLRLPIVQRVDLFDTRVQRAKTGAAAAIRDFQTVTSRITVNYHVEPKTVAALAAAPLVACGRGAEPAPPAGGGISIQPAPLSIWDRLLALFVPATVYGKVVFSEVGGGRYELVCSETTTYVLRGIFLNFKRYVGKKVIARGYVRGTDSRGKPVLWAVRVVPLLYY